MSEEANTTVKPALKKNSQFSPSETTMKTDDHSNKHLSWDEHAIEEHDQLRGTRMKVRPQTHIHKTH